MSTAAAKNRVLAFLTVPATEDPRLTLNVIEDLTGLDHDALLETCMASLTVAATLLQMLASAAKAMPLDQVTGADVLEYVQLLALAMADISDEP